MASAPATAAAQSSLRSAFLKFWNHPAGPKTIFFWAPATKWAIVGAGLSDINRPAESLSLQQSFALALTGLIWSRYSVVIVPVNYNLMSVNLFVGATGFFQLYRIWDHRRRVNVTENENV
ncbi:putative mitochondrion protein [Zopfochytrium polystomum]|nr:putative mitochondrion protein [Zopfochytrium polystomum]